MPPTKHRAGVSGRTLVLVRHGHAQQAAGTCIGWTDLPLSRWGSDRIAALLADWHGVPDELHTSDLVRAGSSAAIFASAWGLVPRVDPRLREMNFGSWEGRAWDAIEQERGTRFPGSKPSWIHERNPQGESFADVLIRVAGWKTEMLDRSVAAKVMVVGHAGSLRALLCLLTGTPAERAFDFTVELARATVLASTAAGWAITAEQVSEVRL